MRNFTGIRRTESAVADLIAIGYPDETTAEAAADEARQLARDLIIEPDAIAVIVRDADGDCSACCSSYRSSGWPSARGWVP
jgi:uncharacterized membrane protein